MSILQPGEVIDDTYQVEHLLGSGGMAHVYVVKHQRMPRKFALKVLQIEAALRSDFLRRFEREAEILATLRHAHIVDVIDCNKLPDGNPYLVMELLEGEDLATFIARSGALSLPIALNITRQIGEALEAAHRVGVTHRDLKPSNIFLCKHGGQLNFVKVLDFGIAKQAAQDHTLMTAPAQIMGTPGYMAPEQARGETHRIGPATDQFALAATLYEMLSGHGAFYRPGDTLFATIERAVFSKPEPLPYPQVNEAVQQALSKEPDARFPTLSSFLAAVGATTNTVFAMPVVTLRPSLLNSMAAESTRIAPTLSLSARKLGVGVMGLSAATLFVYLGWSVSKSTLPTARSMVTGASQALHPSSTINPPWVDQRVTEKPAVAAPSALPHPQEQDLRKSDSANHTVVKADPQRAAEDPPKPAASASKDAEPVDAAPELEAEPKQKSRAVTRFALLGFASAKSPPAVAALQCAKAHLGVLGLESGAVIRLERSGTLTVVSNQKSVHASGFNLCLRQQLSGIPPQLLPMKASIIIRR